MRLVRRPSPAMVVAVVALFVALSGGAYATTQALITSRQIANHTIRVVDMHASAVKALRGQRGPRGAPGSNGVNGVAGAQGLPGPAGANGGFDPNKVTFRVGPDTTIVGGSVVNSLSVSCLLGEIAIGGGFFSSVGFAYTDRPSGSTGWGILIDASDSSINGTGRGYVICARA